MNCPIWSWHLDILANNIDSSHALLECEFLTPPVVYPESQHSKREKTRIGRTFYAVRVSADWLCGVICVIRSRLADLVTPCPDLLRLTFHNLPSFAFASVDTPCAREPVSRLSLTAEPRLGCAKIMEARFSVKAFDSNLCQRSSESRTSHSHLSAIRLESQ